MINIFPSEIGTYISSPGTVFRGRQNWKENLQIEENVKNIESEFGLNKAVFLAQHHSCEIITITEENLDETLYADACITNLKNISLNVVVADCVPILLYDRKNTLIAAVHSGWRGASEKILTKTLQKMQSDFGSFSEDIYVYFGPSICQDCYEVGQEVAILFSSEFIQPSSNSGKFLLDVKASCIKEARVFGILESHIQVSSDCTFELREKYFSYRRTGRKENFAVGIFIRDVDISS